MTSTAVLHLARAVASDGLAPHLSAIDELVDIARGQGVPAVLVDVLADAGAPEIARTRALDRIIAELHAARRAPSVTERRVLAPVA